MPQSSEKGVEGQKRKHKKEKKHKEPQHKKHDTKHKKKAHNRRYSSSSSSSSDESGDEWEEKPIRAKNKEEPIKHDDWMDISSIIPTYTKKDLVRKERPEPETHELEQNKPGSSTRELNPYWKDGGEGLPTTEKQTINSNIGDRGSSWLRKAYQRAMEQAKEEGRSLEEIAAERWGSLEKLQAMIHRAEAPRSRPAFTKPSSDWSSSGSRRQGMAFSKPSDDWNSGRDDYKPSTERHKAWKKKHSPEQRSSDYQEQDNDKAWKKKRSQSRERHSHSERSPERKESINTSPERNSQSHEQRELTHKYNECSNMHSERTKCHRERPNERSERSNLCNKKSYERSERSNEESNRNVHQEIISEKTSSKTEHERDKCGTIVSLTEYERNELGAKIIKAELMGNMTLANELRQKLEFSKSTKVKNPIKLTENDLNSLGAKLVKAELSGNTKLVNELKQKLEIARKGQSEDVVLATTSREGFTRPVYDSEEVSYENTSTSKSRKKHKVETHRGGVRERYFADDDKYSLKDMFEKERLTNAEDHDAEFVRLIGKEGSKATSDFIIDDIFESKSNRSDTKANQRVVDRALREHKTMKRSIENCNWCVDSKEMPKHMLVSLGSKALLALPSYNSLTTGHCIIAPISHVPCGTQVDEDIWEEMQKFRSELVKLFLSQDMDVIFIETAMNLKRFPHMNLHCVPVPKEIGDLAPIYFKKAIMECETEWTHNVKVVDLKGKDVRRAVPKGLSYFSVDFGLQPGFAHVIEDEKDFPHYFGFEIIGGMLDLDPYLWRKPKKETFDIQCKKSIEFGKIWQPFEFNKKIEL